MWYYRRAVRLGRQGFQNKNTNDSELFCVMLIVDNGVVVDDFGGCCIK